MNVHLISAILKNIWAIDPEAALSYAPLLNNLIGQGTKLEFSFAGQVFAPSAFNAVSVPVDEYTNWSGIPAGSIAVIPLNGPLMKDDQYCGPVGMATIGKVIKAADDSENIDAIILHIDSPGGTVDGTVALAEIIAAVRKPILAFADGLMASAALWIGSAADEIIAGDGKTSVGSIGVMMSFADLQPAYEKLGVKFHSIVADQSKDKNALFEAVRSGKYDDYKKEVLNPLAEDFITAMRKNRPEVKDDQLTGKVYFAESVVGSLVDSVGNFDHAIQRAMQLADQYKKSLKQKNTIPMNKQYVQVNKVLGVEKMEATQDGIFLNEEQLEALENRLSKALQDESALAEATQAKEKAETDLAAAEQSMQEKDQQITQLKRNAGAESAAVIASSDPEPVREKSQNVTDPEKSFTENLDAVSEAFM